MAQFCDREVQRTIPRLRARLASFALANVSVISREDLAHELTWNELLHTSYFEIARFCKLLAYNEIRPSKSAAIDLDAAALKSDNEILEREDRAVVAS
jgi:hypothetical protein